MWRIFPWKSPGLHDLHPTLPRGILVGNVDGHALQCFRCDHRRSPTEWNELHCNRHHRSHGTGVGPLEWNGYGYHFREYRHIYLHFGIGRNGLEQAKMCFRAASQIAATAGCLSLCSTEMA